MTNKPSQPEDQPPADERNIVALDSSYEGASLEDQIFLFWHNYKNIILAVCVVAILALAGWGILTVVQERREAAIQAAYQEAVSIDELRAFADEHSPHSLAGAAYLRVADYHFENEEYAEAAEFYERASADLENPAAAGRSQVGRGVALALAGQENEALAHLEEVARNPDHLSAIRTEAHYHAASLAIELGQTELARNHLDQVMELDRSQMWASRAMRLQQSLPPPAPEPVEGES